MSDNKPVIVERGGGSNTTAIVALVVILVLVVAGWYFLLGPGANKGGSIDVNVNLPSLQVPGASQ
jgi:hypothetical protein